MRVTGVQRLGAGRDGLLHHGDVRASSAGDRVQTHNLGLLPLFLVRHAPACWHRGCSRASCRVGVQGVGLGRKGLLRVGVLHPAAGLKAKAHQAWTVAPVDPLPGGSAA